MRYSIRAALTTVLVGVLVSVLTGRPGFGTIAAVAVMGVYILEAIDSNKESQKDDHKDA